MDDKSSICATDSQVTALLELALDAVIQARMLMATQAAASDPKQGGLSDGYNIPIEAFLPHTGKAGKVGVRILLRLLDEPDQYVPHGALAEAAALRSRTSNAVKVYICYLRNALREGGYSPEMIETGRLSYRIRSRDVEKLLKFLFGS